MSGMIPRAFIDEVLARTSLVDYIDSHISLIKRGKNFLACCPFHNEKTPSFNVIPDKQFYYCFGCGASGNAISFAMNYLNKDFLTAVEELAAQVGLSLPQLEKQAGHQPNTNKVYGFLDEVSQAYHQELKKTIPAMAYLNQRGLSERTIDHFELGFAPDNWHFISNRFPGQQKVLLETGMLIKNDKGNIYDRYRGRVMFPIRDKRGRVIAFGGRVIAADKQPKYLNSPETPYFHKGRELYGLHHIQKRSPAYVLIVEGYMDVIALFEQGIEDSVATLGTATSSHHIQTLFKSTDRLIFCFDGDQAGRRAASRALSLCLPVIQDNQSIDFMFLPEGEDPDSLARSQGKQGFEALIQQAQSLFDFFFYQLKREANPVDPQGRSKLFHLAKPQLTTMPRGALKEMIFNQLALLCRIEKPRLIGLLEGDNAVSEATLLGQPRLNQRPKLSAMRMALALLIQNPQLYAQLPSSVDFELLKQNENVILGELLQVISNTHQTAQLIEHWRDKADFNIVCKLAALPLNIPESGELAELIGALHQIEKNTLQTQIDGLLYKANIENLSTSEKERLQQLIKQKKQAQDLQKT